MICTSISSTKSFCRMSLPKTRTNWTLLALVRTVGNITPVLPRVGTVARGASYQVRSTKLGAPHKTWKLWKIVIAFWVFRNHSKFLHNTKLIKIHQQKEVVAPWVPAPWAPQKNFVTPQSRVTRAPSGCLRDVALFPEAPNVFADQPSQPCQAEWAYGSLLRIFPSKGVAWIPVST